MLRRFGEDTPEAPSHPPIPARRGYPVAYARGFYGGGNDPVAYARGFYGGGDVPVAYARGLYGIQAPGVSRGMMDHGQAFDDGSRPSASSRSHSSISGQCWAHVPKSASCR